MDTQTTSETLFNEFAGSDAASWKAQLTRDLKGITFDDLSVTDRNGISIKPFYTAEEAKTGTTLFTRTDWAICAAVNGDSEAEQNRNALIELSGGASGLCFKVTEKTDLVQLLAGIELPYIYLQFIVNGDVPAFFRNWHALVIDRGLADQKLDIDFNADPIANHLEIPAGEDADLQHAFLQCFDETAAIFAHAQLYQNAGANSSYQLACITGQLNEYLHWLDVSGRLAELKKVTVSLSTGTDFFEEIAKLRALRSLMGTLFHTYGVTPQVHLHVESSDTYRAPFDRYSNLLRDTLSGMAAVCGGCDSLMLHSFDQNSVQRNEAFGSRMSRNQQLIFKEESYLNLVADVAAGSFYLETLTEALAQAAWQTFQVMEQSGGLVQTFRSGALKAAIEEQATAWINEYREGKRVLVGVNKYVDSNDRPQDAATIMIPQEGIKRISLWNAIL